MSPTGRALGEAAAVGAGAVAVTVGATWPQATHLTSTVPGNLGDPLYFAWQMAWVGHALGTEPGGLWTTNAFSGAPDNLAFTDAILGYAPLSLLTQPFVQGQAGALLVLNLAGLLGTALSLCGGYALARVHGAGVIGSLVAGVGFGLAPWRLEQVIHVNVVATGGMALTLAALSYGNGWSLRHGWRPDRVRPGWVLAGWALACWQLTLGFAVGIPFAYVLALVMGLWAAGWALRGRRTVPRLPGRFLAAHAAGGLGFAALGYALTRPYLRVVEANPGAQRTEAMLDLFSPPWFGLLTAPETSRFWGERTVDWRAEMRWTPEMVVSPGIALILLAALGLVVSVWPARRRWGLAAATAVTTLLALGTQAPGGGRWTYLPIYQHLPGWEALRTPGRLIIWVTIGLALLAAGAVARLVQLAWQEMDRVQDRTVRRWIAVPVAAMLVAPALVVGYEGLGRTPHWEVAPSPVAVGSLPEPVLFLPSDVIGDYHMMLWSTDGWLRLVNGGSAFDPEPQVRLRAQVKTFPDAASVAALRAGGVATVVVVRSRAAGGQWQDAADRPVDGLGIGREDRGDGVVFDLRPVGTG